MIEIARRHVVPAAFDLLPQAMRSKEALAFLIAIGHQESRFAHRRQVVLVDGVRKPGLAIGYWQFEALGAVRGVLSHAATSTSARDLLVSLGYPRDLTVTDVWARLEHNDILAAGFARLLLWTVPAPLPRSDQEDEAWRQYSRLSWNPGRPHRGVWAEAWRLGWSA